MMHNAIAYHLLTNIQFKPEQQLPPPVNSTHLCTGHGILWYGIYLCLVWVSCPGYDPFWLLVYLFTSKAWETAKSLI